MTPYQSENFSKKSLMSPLTDHSAITTRLTQQHKENTKPKTKITRSQSIQWWQCFKLNFKSNVWRHGEIEILAHAQPGHRISARIIWLFLVACLSPHSLSHQWVPGPCRVLPVQPKSIILRWKQSNKCDVSEACQSLILLMGHWHRKQSFLSCALKSLNFVISC